jgi:hypothetical protein
MEVEFGFEFHQSKKSLYWFPRDGSYPIRNNRIRVENKRPDPKPMHLEDFFYVILIFLASFCSSRQQWERQCYNNSPTAGSICCSIAQPCRSVCHGVFSAVVCPELCRVVQSLSLFPYFLRVTWLILLSLWSISSIFPRSSSTCFYVLFLSYIITYILCQSITNLSVFYLSTLMFPLLIWTCTCSPMRLYLDPVLGIRDILVRIRMRIREAQKHTDSDPDADL